MLDCPICGSDYSEIGLDAGRCRVCGSVIAWEEEGLDEQVSPPPPNPVEPPSGIGSPISPYGHGIGPDGLPETPATDEQHPSEELPSTAPPTPSVDPVNESPPAPPAPSPQSLTDRTPGKAKRSLSDSELGRLDAIWRNTYEPTSRPGSTLQQTAKPGVDTQLVIQKRDVGGLDDRDIPIGRVDYQLLRVVGKGGVGIVYSARQGSIDRDVCVKMLQPELTTDREQCEKFLSEAVVTGELEHPNIVPIYDLGRNQTGDLFYSMKYVRGTPWSERIASMSLTENIEVLLKVADAIAFAHSRSVIHRDIKPENVMLGDYGEVLVLDWGIAVSTSSDFKSGLLGETGMGGTPVYMAPEMATGPAKAIGIRSDVYLLGAVLFEILSGSPPHPGTSVRECLQSAAANVIADTQVTGELLDIAMHAMRTRPADRHADVLEFQRDIRDYQSHSESIHISDRAQNQLSEGLATGNYDSFAQAIFGFEQAYTLWEGNDAAREGADEARIAYASQALENEDFDLGISLLDSTERSHLPVLKKLEAGRAERINRQQRVAALRRVVAAMMLLMLVSATVAVIVFSKQASDLRISEGEANDQKVLAIASAKDAEAKKILADKAKDDAQKSAKAAEAARQVATTARALANTEADKARLQEALAQGTAYRMAMLLAPQQIMQNDFGQARATLHREQESVRRKLRHFEWGRLQYVATELDVTVPTAGAPANDPDDPNDPNDGNAGDGNRDIDSATGVAINSVDCTPDKRVCVAGARTGQVLVWQRGVRAAPTVINLGQPVHAVRVSSDGSTLVVAYGNEGHVGVWPLAPTVAGQIGNELPSPLADTPPIRLQPHRQKINQLQFSPDQQSMLSCSDDETSLIWDVQSGKVLRTLRGHLGPVNDAAFSADGRWVATASNDATVRVWALRPGQPAEEVERFRGHQGPVLCVAFEARGDATNQGASGLRLASGGQEGLLVWRSSAPQLVATAAGLNISPREAFLQLLVHSIQDSAGHVATFSSDKPMPESLRPFLQWNHRVIPLEGHVAAILDVGFTGGNLVSAGQDSTLRVWDPSETAEPDANRLLKTLAGHGSTVSSISLPAARPDEIVSGSFDRTVRHWQVSQYEWVDSFGKSGASPASASALSADGRLLVVAYGNGVAKVYDTSTRQELTSLDEGHEYLTYNAIYFDEGKKVLTVAGDSRVIAWDTQRGIELGRIEHTGYRGVAALASDEKTLATGSERNTAILWNLQRSEKLAEMLATEVGEQRKLLHSTMQRRAGETDAAFDARLEQRLPDVSALGFSPDQDVVVLGDTNGRCWVCDAKTGATLSQFQAHDQTVNAISFFRYGSDQVCVTASDDRTVAVWRVAYINGQATVTEFPNSRMPHPHAINLLKTTNDGDGISIYTVCAEPKPEERVQEAADVQAKADRRRMQVRRWRWRSEQPPRVVAIPADRINSLDIKTPKQPVLLLACLEDGKTVLREWDVEKSDAAEPLWSDDRQRGLITTSLFSKPEPGVLTVGGSGARRWSRELGRKMLSFRPHSALTDVGFLPPELVVEKLDDDKMVLRPRRADEPKQTLLYTASVDGSVKIWHAALDESQERAQAIWRLEGSLSEAPQLQGHRGAINSASFAIINGQPTLLTASEDGTAKLWVQDASAQWTVRRTLAGHAKAVRNAGFFPGNQWVLTVSDDKQALLWRLGDQAGDLPPREFPFDLTQDIGHDGPIRCAAVTRDGKWIATGGDDHTIHLWSTEADETGPVTHLVKLERHSQPVFGLAFSRDRRRLFSVGADGQANVWDLDNLHDVDVNQPFSKQSLTNSIQVLLTMSGQNSSVTSVGISDSGQQTVTTGANGLALVWKGVEVEPALLIPGVFLEYQVAKREPLHLAKKAVVSMPTIANFSEYKLIAKMNDPAPKWNERLSLDMSNPATVGSLRQDGASLLYQQWESQSAVVIGEISNTPADQLEIVLTSDADNFAIESLLHRIIYQSDPDIDGDETRIVQFGLYNPQGEMVGNLNPEQRLIYLEVPDGSTESGSLESDGTKVD